MLNESMLDSIQCAIKVTLSISMSEINLPNINTINHATVQVYDVDRVLYLNTCNTIVRALMSSFLWWFFRTIQLHSLPRVNWFFNLYSILDRFDSRSIASGGRRVEPGSSGSVFLGVSVVKVIVDGLKRYQMMFLVNWEPGKVMNTPQHW